MFLDVLPTEVEPNGAATVITRFNSGLLQNLDDLWTLLSPHLNVHMTIGRGPARMKPAEIVAARSERNMMLVVRDSRIAFRGRSHLPI
jgi:hypothetical protein